MKVENVSVFNLENALRGMRNPLDSWDKSDSCYKDKPLEVNNYFISNMEFTIGGKDIDLCKKLINGGTEHRKFLRQIFVSMDITMPRYWWLEMDTYKINTTANSCSTMHKLNSYPFTLDMFELDDKDGWDMTDDYYWTNEIKYLEGLREKYNKTNNMKYFRKLKQALPESFLQKRTWTANYEVLRNIYQQRKNHKLLEWHFLCEVILTLPYAEELIIS